MSKRSRREPPPPEFFIDRSLGSEKVPERLRAAGLIVHVMDDVYPGLDDLDDEVWIPEQTALGRVLLTKDKRIRRRKAEQEAVEAAHARMFSLPRGDMTGDEQAVRFYENRYRIIQHSRKSGPYIYVVQERSLDLAYPRSS